MFPVFFSVWCGDHQKLFLIVFGDQLSCLTSGDRSMAKGRSVAQRTRDLVPVGWVHTPALLHKALLGQVEAALVTGGAETRHRQSLHTSGLQLAVSALQKGW